MATFSVAGAELPQRLTACTPMVPVYAPVTNEAEDVLLVPLHWAGTDQEYVSAPETVEAANASVEPMQAKVLPVMPAGAWGGAVQFVKLYNCWISAYVSTLL